MSTNRYPKQYIGKDPNKIDAEIARMYRSKRGFLKNKVKLKSKSFLC